MADVAQMDYTQQTEEFIPLWRTPFAAWRLTNLEGHIAESVQSRGNKPGMTTVLVQPEEDGTAPTLTSYTDDEGNVQKGYQLWVAAPFFGGDQMSLYVPKDYNGIDSIVKTTFTATPIDASLQDIQFNRSLNLMELWFIRQFQTSLLKERTWSRISEKNRFKIMRAISKVPTLKYLASSASRKVM